MAHFSLHTFQTECFEENGNFIFTLPNFYHEVTDFAKINVSIKRAASTAAALIALYGFVQYSFSISQLLAKIEKLDLGSTNTTVW